MKRESSRFLGLAYRAASSLARLPAWCVGSVVLALAASACYPVGPAASPGRAGDQDQDLGTIVLALTTVPDDVHCMRVGVVFANQTVTLIVNDNLPAGCQPPSCNRNKWSIQTNFQVGNAPFGDRTYTIDSVGSGVLLGRPWIRTAADSKNFSGEPLATFTSGGTAVFLLIDDRHNGASGRPGWLTDAGFVDQGFNVVVRQSATATYPYSVWKKSVIAGSTVALPRVGPTFSGLGPGYFVVQ